MEESTFSRLNRFWLRELLDNTNLEAYLALWPPPYDECPGSVREIDRLIKRHEKFNQDFAKLCAASDLSLEKIEYMKENPGIRSPGKFDHLIAGKIINFYEDLKVSLEELAKKKALRISRNESQSKGPLPRLTFFVEMILVGIRLYQGDKISMNQFRDFIAPDGELFNTLNAVTPNKSLINHLFSHTGGSDIHEWAKQNIWNLERALVPDKEDNNNIAKMREAIEQKVKQIRMQHAIAPLP